MITNRIDFSDTRNLIIVSLILTVGIGGAALSVGNFSMAGIGLAALLGVVLNLVLPRGATPTCCIYLICN
jgi:uracil permease